MRILVVGDGKVGHVLAEHLTREGHNVVIVDIDEEALQRSEDTLDVMCIKGNGASLTALKLWESMGTALPILCRSGQGCRRRIF